MRLRARDRLCWQGSKAGRQAGQCADAASCCTCLSLGCTLDIQAVRPLLPQVLLSTYCMCWQGPEAGGQAGQGAGAAPGPASGAPHSLGGEQGVPAQRSRGQAPAQQVAQACLAPSLAQLPRGLRPPGVSQSLSIFSSFSSLAGAWVDLILIRNLDDATEAPTMPESGRSQPSEVPPKESRPSLPGTLRGATTVFWAPGTSPLSCSRPGTHTLRIPWQSCLQAC